MENKRKKNSGYGTGHSVQARLSQGLRFGQYLIDMPRFGQDQRNGHSFLEPENNQTSSEIP